jgi:hypothetical protein
MLIRTVGLAIHSVQIAMEVTSSNALLVIKVTSKLIKRLGVFLLVQWVYMETISLNLARPTLLC